jgi:hypothetical protein
MPALRPEAAAAVLMLLFESATFEILMVCF